MKSLLVLYYVAIISLFSLCFAQYDIEWCDVSWIRNYYHGKDSAIAKNKPVFLQFQEVPG